MKKIPNHAITLFRDGKQVHPTVGVPFDFTKKEIEDIEEAAGPDALRDPVDESTIVDPVAEKAAKEQMAKVATPSTKKPAPSDDI